MRSVVLFTATALLANQAMAQTCSGTPAFDSLGTGTPGVVGVPWLEPAGVPIAGRTLSMEVSAAAPGAFGTLFFGTTSGMTWLPQFGAVAHLGLPLLFAPFVVGDDGTTAGLLAQTPVTPLLCGLDVFLQAVVFDAAATGGLAFTRGVALGFGTAVEEPLFGLPTWSLGSTTRSRLGVADLDGNGRLDVLCFGEDARLHVHFNHPGAAADVPSFLEVVAPMPGASNFTRWYATGDWNGDGLDDLATFHGASGSPVVVTTFLGSGTGTVAAAATLDLPDQGAAGLEAGDFDGDGVLDLVLSSFSDGHLRHLPGNGDGTFQVGATTPFVGVGRVARGEFDADGVLDVAVLGPVTGEPFMNGIHLLTGDGDGTFTPFTVVPLGARGRDLDVADVDGDGYDDVLSNVVSFVKLFRNDGVPGGGLLTTIDSLFGLCHASFADLDGDGDADILASMCHGDGNASEDTSWTFLNDGAGAFVRTGPYPSGSDGGIPAVADVTGDGVLDLLLPAVPDDRFGVVPGTGDGGFVVDRTVVELFGRPVLADFDEDGRRDVLHWWPSGSTISFGDGAGGFPRTAILSFGSDDTPELADLDLDGHLDLIWVDGDDQVVVGLGDGTGAFATAQGPWVSSPGIEVADLNLDGIPDLAWCTVSGATRSIDVALGAGDGTFLAVASLPLPTSFQPRLPRAADVDCDGVPDLIFASGPSVQMVKGNGDGTLQAPQLVDAQPFDWGVVGLEVADMDLDGCLDVVVVFRRDSFASPSESVLRTALGGPPGVGFSVEERVLAPNVDYEPRGLLLADLDADGFPDALTFDADLHTCTVVRNSGWNATEVFPPGATLDQLGGVDGMYGAAVGDLDGDGAVDLVVGGGVTAVLPNQLLR